MIARWPPFFGGSGRLTAHPEVTPKTEFCPDRRPHTQKRRCFFRGLGARRPRPTSNAWPFPHTICARRAIQAVAIRPLRKRTFPFAVYLQSFRNTGAPGMSVSMQGMALRYSYMARMSWSVMF